MKHKKTNNPKDIIGRTKVPLSLVPPALTIHVAMAMKNGAFKKKYGPYNWRTDKVSAMVYLDAAKRHLECLVDGEDIAPDSKCHHAAHVAACMGIYLDAMESGNLRDDRPLPGPGADLLRRFNKRK